MRRIIIPLITSILMIMSACTSADEEGPYSSEQDTEDQVLLAYLFSNGYILPESYFWEGSANIESCQGNTAQTNTLCTTLIDEGLTIQQLYQSKNLHVALTGSQSTGVWNTKMLLIAPHFNAVPFAYEVELLSAFTPGAYQQSPILTGAQTGTITVNPGYYINVTTFRGEDRPEGLIGTFTVFLTSDNVTGHAVLEYNFSAADALQ
ncbi:MAG: hypothetical protein KDK34_11785 [Leptospiraceae bacterium]|nr:hypothetical protein [Leptospiraceae bacterium]